MTRPLRRADVCGWSAAGAISDEDDKAGAAMECAEEDVSGTCQSGAPPRLRDVSGAGSTDARRVVAGASAAAEGVLPRSGVVSCATDMGERMHVKSE